MSAQTVFLVLLLGATSALGAYQSAGCSDEGCGIPCYLQPAEDICHYTNHVESPCDDGGGDDLLMKLWNLNNTLVRLQEKLIQKGIIPAGDNCRPLPIIEHGGVIYSDLLISTGVIGTYVCEEGFRLHGQGRYECAVDGSWLGNTTGQMPTCEDSLIICLPLFAIPNGHITYTIEDTTLIKPGDVVVYSCEQPYTLEGSSYRVCLNNGTWTGQEPKCIAPGGDDSTSGTSNTDDQVQRMIETVVPAGILAIIVAILLIIIIILIVRRKKDGQVLSGDSTRKAVGIKNENESEPERLILTETVSSSESAH